MADVMVSPAGLITMRKPYADRRVQRSFHRILRENILCSMSTIAPGNRAHINTAFFAYSPGLEFYFLSDPSSLHCRNVRRNPSFAMAIFRSDQGWDAPGRGVQLFGRCGEIHRHAAREAGRWYAKRFPAYARHLRGRREEDRRMAAGLRVYRFYRFVPRTVKILDEAEFGSAVFVVSDLPRRR